MANEFHTIKSFASLHPAFSEQSLRRLVFGSKARRRTVDGVTVEVPANGFALAFPRVAGRRIAVDSDKFFSIIRAQQAAAVLGC